MANQALLKALTAEMNRRHDALTGIAGDTADSIAMQFQYQNGVLYGLDIARQWLKQLEADELSGDDEDTA